MHTTLNRIKDHSPCDEGWAKLLLGLNKTQPDDEPLALSKILGINGIKDAIWALRAVDGCDREIRLFACDVAALTLPLWETAYPSNSSMRDFIAATRQRADGQAAEKESEALPKTLFAEVPAGITDAVEAIRAIGAAWAAIGAAVAATSAISAVGAAHGAMAAASWTVNAAENSAKAKGVRSRWRVSAISVRIAGASQEASRAMLADIEQLYHRYFCR